MLFRLSDRNNLQKQKSSWNTEKKIITGKKIVFQYLIEWFENYPGNLKVLGPILESGHQFLWTLKN